MLYMMRHGKTDWNLQFKLQGGTDIPLNDMGREMASNASTKYQDVHFDVCYVSPLIRARETAELFLQNRDIPVIIDNRLSEMAFGEYEGVTDVFHHPELNIYKFFKAPAEYVPDKGAESFESLLSRTKEFLDEVALPLVEQGKDVLIVGHGAMNSALYANVNNIPLEDFWAIGIENCKLIKLK